MKTYEIIWVQKYLCTVEAESKEAAEKMYEDGELCEWDAECIENDLESVNEEKDLPIVEHLTLSAIIRKSLEGSNKIN